MYKYTASYPERNHGGEVEGRDAGGDSQRHSEGQRVHVPGDLRHGLPELQAGDAAAVLHHLCNRPGRRSEEISDMVSPSCRLVMLQQCSTTSVTGRADGQRGSQTWSPRAAGW